MAKSLIELTTFAAGQVGKRLRARRDLARYQAGLDKLENMVVLLEGGVTRRSGTRFVLPNITPDFDPVFVPFRYSGGDAYELVICGGYIRFLQNGGFVYNAGLPFQVAVVWANADLPNLRWTQSGNVIFFTCPGYRPKVLTRIDHLNWTYVEYSPTGGPVDPDNLDMTKVIIASAVSGTIALSANFTCFNSGQVGSVFRLDELQELVSEWNPNEAVVVGDLRRFKGNVYRADNNSNTGLQQPVHTEGYWSSGNGKTTWLFKHPGYGFVQILAVTDGANATALVLGNDLPNSVVATGTWHWWPPAWSTTAGFPQGVRLFDNRLKFWRGGDFWITRQADFYSFEVTATPEDSAIIGRLTSPDGSEVNIEWVLACGVLVVGARDGEWIIRGVSTYDALTYTNIRPIPADNEGSAPQVPALTDLGALFIGRSRKRLHHAPFDGVSEKLDVDEISKSARGILDGDAMHIAWQRDPNRIAWIACATGNLIGLTFMPKESVVGWHEHPMTNGQVRTVGSIPSSDEAVSDVYLCVSRTIGASTRRYIEFLMPFFEPLDADNPTAEGAWFVDCGLQYSGAETTLITGLDHLEGQEVAIHADGCMMARQTVVAGRITLPFAASDVVVGLPIAYKARSLNLNAQTPAGSTKGKIKNASHVIIDVLESAGGQVSINDGPKTDLQETGTVDYGVPIPLVTDELRATVGGQGKRILTVEVSGDDTMPFTLLGMAPDVDSNKD